MTSEIKRFTSLNFWRGVSPLVFSWAIIFTSVKIASVYVWSYPLAVFIIANRIMALGLLAHEGIHGLLSKNKSINDFIARYFCAFPVFISLARWRLRHELHHRFVGTHLDYDKYLYTYYPVTWKKFFWHFFSGQMLFGHFWYFTDLDLILGKLPVAKYFPVPVAQRIPFQKNDLKSFAFFHVLLFGGAIHFDFLSGYLFFWIVPFLLCQPMTLLYNCMEHAEIYEAEDINLRSRSILDKNIFMPMLLPLNVNFHGEHHLFPQVPQYHLAELSDEIRKSNSNGQKLYYQNLTNSLKAVFKL